MEAIKNICAGVLIAISVAFCISYFSILGSFNLLSNTDQFLDAIKIFIFLRLITILPIIITTILVFKLDEEAAVTIAIISIIVYLYSLVNSILGDIKLFSLHGISLAPVIIFMFEPLIINDIGLLVGSIALIIVGTEGSNVLNIIASLFNIAVIIFSFISFRVLKVIQADSTLKFLYISNIILIIYSFISALRE